MKRRLVFSDLARIDVASIMASIREHNPAAAARFRQQVKEIANLLVDHPDMGTSCGFTEPGCETFRVRTVPGFENYLVFYYAIESELEIARVMYGGRDWQAGIKVR